METRKKTKAAPKPKPPQKSNGIAVASPIVEKANAALASLKKSLVVERENIDAAKEKVKQARAKAAKSTRAIDKRAAKAASNAAKKALARAAGLRARVRQLEFTLALKKKSARLRARVQVANERFKKLSTETRYRAVREAAKKKLLAHKGVLSAKADADKAKALVSYAAIWMKKRASADAKKLRITENKLEAKLEKAAKKAGIAAPTAKKKAPAKKKVAAKKEAPAKKKVAAKKKAPAKKKQ